MGISDLTLKKLFSLSKNICAFPKCSEEIYNTKHNSIIGEICHIKSKKPNGPRYDPSQTKKENDSYENLIVMCRNHHKIIDDDEISYNVDRLHKIKKVHESRKDLLDLPDSLIEILISIFENFVSTDISTRPISIKNLQTTSLQTEINDFNNLEIEPAKFSYLLAIIPLNCHIDTHNQTLGRFLTIIPGIKDTRGYPTHFELIPIDFKGQFGEPILGKLTKSGLFSMKSYFDKDINSEKRRINIYSVLLELFGQITIFLSILNHLNWKDTLNIIFQLNNLKDCSLNIGGSVRMWDDFTLPYGEDKIIIEKEFKFKSEKKELIKLFDSILVELCQNFGYEFGTRKNYLREIIQYSNNYGSYKVNNETLEIYFFDKGDF